MSLKGRLDIMIIVKTLPDKPVKDSKGIVIYPAMSCFLTLISLLALSFSLCNILVFDDSEVKPKIELLSVLAKPE